MSQLTCRTARNFWFAVDMYTVHAVERLSS